MPRDNDDLILKRTKAAITDLEVKFRALALEDREAVRPSLEEMLNDYAGYRLQLLKKNIITTAEDLTEMTKIQADIDAAADKQDLIKAIARLAAMVAVKI